MLSSLVTIRPRPRPGFVFDEAGVAVFLVRICRFMTASFQIATGIVSWPDPAASDRSWKASSTQLDIHLEYSSPCCCLPICFAPAGGIAWKIFDVTHRNPRVQ